MRARNRVAKGKRLEKLFRETIKELFPNSQTELKPMLRFMQKDFWGLFDGLTFFPHKRVYLFWQIKSNKMTQKERAAFWKAATHFETNCIAVLLVEKHKEGYHISRNPELIPVIKHSDLKSFFLGLIKEYSKPKT